MLQQGAMLAMTGRPVTVPDRSADVLSEAVLTPV